MAGSCSWKKVLGGLLGSGVRGESGGAATLGSEMVRASLFFGMGGGVASEWNLTWCREGPGRARKAREERDNDDIGTVKH